MQSDKANELRQLIREVVLEAVPPTVDATLERFGFEVKDAKAMQSDMEHLRKLRRGSELIRGTAIKTSVGAAALGLIWVLIEGLRAWTKSGMNH